MAAKIEGTCDPRFNKVKDAFAANFETAGEVGFGYVMNQMGSDPLLDPRARRLFEALYSSL